MIKRIFKKILGIKNISLVEKYIRDGIVTTGNGCNLGTMSIYVVHPEINNINVIIGDNVCIKGLLVIYNRNSKIIIGNDVYIGPLTILECFDKITIGNHVLISYDCALVDTNSHSLSSRERFEDVNDWNPTKKDWNIVQSKPIIINDHCWVGLKSIIMKGVILGKGTIVGAGSVVTKGTDPYVIVAGNPAKVIKPTT